MFVLSASLWSQIIPLREDTVGCISPCMKAIAQLKDGSPATDDSTNATVHPEEISRSEVSPQHTVASTSQPVKAAIAQLKARQQMKAIAPLKNLPFVDRRSFTSGSGSVQNYAIYGSGDTGVFNEKLGSAIKKLNEELDIESLKAEFASRFRPLFVENFLMLPSTLDDDITAYLHGQAHGFTKEWPLYLSSLDVMRWVKSRSKEHVQHLVTYIIQRRILISEDWNHTYGNIEALGYDANTDPSFVRGECDAAFELLDKADGSGIAKLSVLIWKGSNLIYAEIIEGVKCYHSVGAEVLAALALLMKCKEMGLQKVELWSDSKRAIGVISGFESIYEDDQNRDNCLLLRCMRTEFTELIPVFKQREIVFITDQLLKLEGIIEQRIEKALEK